MRSALLLLGLLGPLACGESPRPVAAVRVPDLAGTLIDPLAVEGLAQVFFFIGTDCPISNRYAPEIQRIVAAFAEKGVGFWLVYPDGADDPAAIRAHLAAYGHTLPVLRDTEHALVSLAGVEVTPEAAVFDARRVRRYRGRIDDRVVDFGRSRPAPTQRDLEQALAAVVTGEQVARAEEPAVGCAIPGPE